VYEQIVAASGVQGIITATYAYSSTADDLLVGVSQAWLADNHGHVLVSALYRPATALGDAGEVAKQLCRAVLTGKRQ
jgi:hypothetical protein